ncbi:MAG: hypothetical protein MUQ10_16510 [Anaerolineae bacterium]|nr:hypothetical protein [Anaerolineae bacterium]
MFLSGSVAIAWGAYVLIALSLVPLALAAHYLRLSRQGSYYGFRRDALRKAQYWGAGAISTLLIALVILILRPPSEPSIPVEPNLTPTLTATRVPTLTPVPTETASPSPTRRATATPPFIPTFTPEVLPPEPAMSPLPSAVPAGPDARIMVMALAVEKDESDGPVDPGDQFGRGFHPVYVFFEYGGMETGYTTSFAWYVDNGEYVDSCLDTWVWGIPEDRQWGERGGAYLECSPPGGWQVGFYELRVFVDTRLQSVACFEVVE